MENLDETDYQVVILWHCHYNYYNAMLQQSKEATHAFPSNENLKIFLAVANILTNRVQEALQISADLIESDENKLAGLLIKNGAHRLDGNKDRAIISQIDAKIRDERRKANYTSLIRAAIVLLLSKKFDKAKEYAERAHKLNSQDLDVLIINNWIDLNYPKRIDNNYFSSIGKEHGRRLNVLLSTAKFHQHNDACEQAILILNALIVRYPKLCLPLIEKMICQLSCKDWDQVLETANRILSIDANNLDAIKAKTVVTLCRDGNYSTGMKNIQLFLRNLLAAEPKNVEIIINNVQLFSRIINRDEETLNELTKIMEKLIQQNSNVCEPMIELGNIFLLMNKIKESEHWFRNAIRIDESSFSALMGLAHCQVLDKSPGAVELARQQLDFLMEIQTNSLDPRLYFMSSKLCHNDSSKALNYLTMALKLILKNIENLSYNYEYLTKLNPDFCLEIVNEYLSHSPTAMAENNDNTLDDDSEQSTLLILINKIIDAYPAFGAALLMLAKANMQNGNYEEALNALKKLLDTVDPTNAMAHLLIAKIFALQGNYQLASQSLEVGLSYNFKVRDEFLYHLIDGIVEKSDGNFDASINSLRTAMKLMDNKTINNDLYTTNISISDKATLYLELIMAYGKLKKFDEANALMSEAKMQFINTMEEGRIMIANAELCLESGDIEKAINYLNDIQAEEPYYLQAHTKLAQIHLHQRKDRHAFAKCFRELVKHCPGPKTYSMLGDAYMAIQEPDRAIEAYEESLKNNPTDKILANKMGKALIKTHQYDRAINYYKDIVKNKGCGDLKLDMAELFMRMKQYDKAEMSLVQELQDGRMANDQLNLEMRVKQLILLAKVQERAEKINVSITTLKEAKETQLRYVQRMATGSGIIEQKKILAEICLKMADHCTVIRDFDGAIIHYKDALQYKSGDVNALLSLAKLYMQVNDLDRGAQSCTALLNADPNNEAASVMMADLAFRKVDFETAAYHFRQLLLRRPTYWTALARLIEVSRRTVTTCDSTEWNFVECTKGYWDSL
ncbi:hypothetical protein PV328_006149 [Microctonus aethiopoides]|uniref:Tetratricopeptide repeat protein 21B n=1 Tax=Microctonus aethiopoides TaxID=144406 RepID=A0AA39KT25_9HYME|nr:hypothetical protein PV328_006149 [Microctonus aethiopoides]